jgi:hypothetical protein
MKASLKLIVVVVVLFKTSLSFSQDKNIVAHFKNDLKLAEELYAKQAYLKAGELFQRIAKKDTANADIRFKIGECYWKLNNTTEAEYWYKEGFKRDNATVNLAEYKLHLAEALVINGKKEEAKIWYDLYSKESLSKRAIAESKKRGLDAYDTFFRDSLFYSVKELPINSPAAEYCPTFYQKGLVFVSNRKTVELVKNVDATDQGNFLDLYYVEFEGDSGFGKLQKFTDFNTGLNEGPITFFDNGKKAVFSRNEKGGGKDTRRLQLFYSEKDQNGKWAKPQPLPFNSSNYSVSHPFYDKNTNCLYFVSDMPGGYGGTDIYRSIYLNGAWMMPENLGASINTSGNEMFPFVSKDSCLYFSSNGLPGMGGLDLFFVDLKNNGSKPLNLGAPLNSSKDDFSLILNDNTSTGFFSSNRKKSGGDDIYRIIIHKIKYEGVLLDKLKAMPLKGVNVRISDTETGKIEWIVKSSNKGTFSCYLMPGRHYLVEAVKEDYKVSKTEVFVNSRYETVVRSKIIMEKVKKSFVKGRVIKDTSLVKNCMVKVFDFSNDSVEVMKTNSAGEFSCEINKDTTNIFYAEYKGARAIYKLEPVQRKRKGSVLTYITLELAPLKLKACEGILLDTLEQPCPNDTLVLSNELTGEEEFVVADKNGKFKFKAWESGRYSLFLKSEDKYVWMETFVPEKLNRFQLRKRKKDEIY